MGLTIFLRWEYSLFGDPVGPLIFAVMFLFGDLVQKLLRVLAGIKVRTASAVALQASVDMKSMSSVMPGERSVAIGSAHAIAVPRVCGTHFPFYFNIKRQSYACQIFVALFTLGVSVTSTSPRTVVVAWGMA